MIHIMKISKLDTQTLTVQVSISHNSSNAIVCKSLIASLLSWDFLLIDMAFLFWLLPLYFFKKCTTLRLKSIEFVSLLAEFLKGIRKSHAVYLSHAKCDKPSSITYVSSSFNSLIAQGPYIWAICNNINFIMLENRNEKTRNNSLK